MELLTPTFGGINLEGIAQPKCFSNHDTLKTRLEIASGRTTSRARLPPAPGS